MDLKQHILNICTSLDLPKNKEGLFEQMAQRVKELGVPDEELFPVLWEEAMRARQDNNNAYASAQILYRLNIKCPLKLEDAIRQMLPGWSVSTEEVPWYLENQFPKEDIVRVTLNLMVEESIRENRAVLKTILYWLDKK